MGDQHDKKCELENHHNFIRFYTSLFHIIQYCISEITMSYIPKFYRVWGKVLLIVYCTHFFHWYMQLVLRWMDPQQHQDCRLRHPTPWFENGCYFYWKHNCHSRIVQAHQRTIHRYVQAQGNKIIEWDFFLSRVVYIRPKPLFWFRSDTETQIGRYFRPIPKLHFKGRI